MSTVTVKDDLLDSFKADREYRRVWDLENVYVGLCSQIRALREQRNLSQAELGESTKPSLKTLLRLADSFDVGLDVRLVLHSTVIDRSTIFRLYVVDRPSFAKNYERSRAERRIRPSKKAS